MIKVGDWVKVNNKGIVGKVTSIEPNKYIEHYGNRMLKNVVFLNNQTVKNYETELTKLHINFKPFEINSNVCELRRIKGNEHNILFIAYETNYEVYASCQEYVDDSKVHSSYFPTIDQAKDWLELQYATLIAKARGLV